MSTKTKDPEAERIDLAEEVGEAQRELASLSEEQERLPGLLNKAAREGDGAAVVKYRQRADELPTLVFAAEVRLLHAQIAHAKLEAELLGPKYAQADEDAERLKAVFEEAERAYREAAGRASVLYATQKEWQLRASEHGLRLDRVIGQNAPSAGPVVRSTWQASA